MKKIKFLLPAILSVLTFISTSSFILYYFITNKNSSNVFREKEMISKIENNKNTINVNKDNIKNNENLTSSNKLEINNTKKEIKNTKSSLDEKFGTVLEKESDLIKKQNNNLKTELEGKIEANINSLKTDNSNLKNLLNNKIDSSKVYTKEEIDKKQIKIRYLESQKKQVDKKTIKNNKEILIQNPQRFISGDTIGLKDFVTFSFLNVAIDGVNYLIQWEGYVTDKKFLKNQDSQMYFSSGKNSKMGLLKVIQDKYNNIKIIFNGATLYNSSEWTPESIEYHFIIQVIQIDKK